VKDLETGKSTISRVTIPNILKPVITYNTNNQRITSKVSLVDSGQKSGNYTIKIENACDGQSALLDVRLYDSLNVTITRPDDLGMFLLNFKQTLQLTNFSEINYTSILIDIERDGNKLTRGKDFSWKCTKFTNTSLTFQLSFDNPFEVSVNDMLYLSFKDPDLFISTDARMLNEGLLLTKPLS